MKRSNMMENLRLFFRSNCFLACVRSFAKIWRAIDSPQTADRHYWYVSVYVPKNAETSMSGTIEDFLFTLSTSAAMQLRNCGSTSKAVVLYCGESLICPLRKERTNANTRTHTHIYMLAHKQMHTIV